MHFRPRHLACVLLLLSSLGAQASPHAAALGAGHFCTRAGYILLLSHGAAATRPAHAPQAPSLAAPLALDLTSQSLAARRISWTMRPPAAHSAALHAVTGLAPIPRL